MKDWYKSRTLWLNLISIAVLIAAELAKFPNLAQYAPYLLLAVNVGNIVLRTITTEPLRLPGQDPGAARARRHT